MSSVFALLARCPAEPALYCLLGNILRNNHKLIQDYSLLTALVQPSLGIPEQLAFLTALLNTPKHVFDDQSDYLSKRYTLTSNQYNIVVNMVDTNGLLQFTQGHPGYSLHLAMLLALVHKHSAASRVTLALPSPPCLVPLTPLSSPFLSIYTFLQMAAVYSTSNP